MERKALCFVVLLAFVVAFAAASWVSSEVEAQAKPETNTQDITEEDETFASLQENGSLTTFSLNEALAQAFPENYETKTTTLAVPTGNEQLSCSCTCGPAKAFTTVASQAPQAPQAPQNKAQAIDAAEACWKQSKGRGVGTPLSTCKTGFDKNGALCYPKCKAGFHGVGPVCWQNCPSGFRDDGAFCGKPAAYGRGAGYVIWDEGKCKSQNPQGCEKNGLMWYPKCKANFHPVGCCVCSPNCVSGMPDIGVSCRKASYGRGAGVKMDCASGLQEDVGLCYNSCPSNWVGVGPVCWQRCPKSKPFECGALCTKDAGVCTTTVKNMVVDTVTAVGKIAAKNPSAVIDTAKAAANFVLPLCSS